MEGKGPYRIYDPGGNIGNLPTQPTSIATSKCNTALMDNIDDIRNLGHLLEESQNEVHKLRQKAEALVKENKHMHVSCPLEPVSPPAGNDSQLVHTDVGQELSDNFYAVQMPSVKPGETLTSPKSNNKTPPSDPGPTIKPEVDTLRLQLQRLENSFSRFTEEPDQSQLLRNMSRMALEFNRLATKVHKNELQTSCLQTLCEQLRKENEDLRAKLEADWNQRAQAEQTLRLENIELKKLILERGETKGVQSACGIDAKPKEDKPKVENAEIQQVSRPASKDPLGALLKKVKVLEHQRAELLDVNKQWDQQFRSMKLQYEEKITSLRQKLSQNLKTESEQEAERDRRQRDFDRKLLLARDKIEEKESQVQKLESEMKDLKQKNKILHDQLNSSTKQREYQEREICRLNKALEEALNLQDSPSLPLSTENLPSRQELAIQNDLLKQQVKIFEEDFQKERRDRERMNEEKEDLKGQLEQLESQLGKVTSQLRLCQDDLRKAKEASHNVIRHQATGERYHVEPDMIPTGPPYPYSPPGIMYTGLDDWQIHYPPPIVPPTHSQIQDLPNGPPPAYQWRVSNVLPRPQHHKGSKKKETEVPAGAFPNTPRQT
uniref:TNFAIP3 interacting protein 1 n=1 Tax=Leptobrachium leishanense TaxID=445787 RepID=A0A8C5PCQ9_9ANUR